MGNGSGRFEAIPEGRIGEGMMRRLMGATGEELTA
jgi:hypothetical protein